MRLILHRYIFVELLKTFALSTAALTLFLSLAYALTELRERGLGPIDSAHLVLYFIPAMLVFAMPVGALLTTTLVYGRLASDNEITACQASGISMSELLKPVLALGLLIGLLTFALYDRVIPWARYRAENVGKQNMERIFFHRIRSRRHVSFRDFFISAKHIQGNVLYGVVLRYTVPSGQSYVAYAPAAIIRFFPPGSTPAPPVEPPLATSGLAPAASAPPEKRTPEQIAEEAWDASVARYGDVFIKLFGFYAYDEGQTTRTSVARGDQSFKRSLDRIRPTEPEEMTLGQLIRRYKRPEETYYVRLDLEHGRSPAELKKVVNRVKARSLAEMHGRYASIASCILLVALGAALGTVFRHGHILTAFFISMGPALFAIFSILLGVKMVKAEPNAMHSLVGLIWAGNIVVLVIDLVLIGRLIRR